MKSYTDISQSKTLSKILSLESADMYFHYNYYTQEWSVHNTQDYEDEELRTERLSLKDYLPCWSLTTLLDILDYPQLSKDKLGCGKAGWMVSAYPNDCRHDSCWHGNPVDACYEMIIKLNELNLL